jgi:murein tripeptide amidase MpaA
VLRISDNAARDEPDEPEVLLMAGIHPREQQPQLCLVRLADELLAGYTKDARLTRLVNEREIWIIPVLNVDGKVYDMRQGNGRDKGADWRKNRRPNADGSVGVDLNRNFGVRWGGNRARNEGWNGATNEPRTNIYEGPVPMSEPETRALADFIAARPLRVFVDIHSPLRSLFFPATCPQASTPVTPASSPRCAPPSARRTPPRTLGPTPSHRRPAPATPV